MGTIMILILAAVAAGSAGAEGILNGSPLQALVGLLGYRGMIQILRVKLAEAAQDLARRKSSK